jgi:hypothetical protein
VRVTGADQYRLDRDRDGLGCEIAGEGGGGRSPYGLTIRKPPRKEATVVRLGDTVTLAGWSPASMRGQPFRVSAGARIGDTVAKGLLTGKVQVFGTTKMTRDYYCSRCFAVRLVVKGKEVADNGAQVAYDTVRVAP